MQSTLDEPTGNEAWAQIAPLLDGALEHLGQKDHDALVLRFCEGRNYAEVGAAIGASEDAAKMRVENQKADLQALTLKVNVDLFITNIIAQANETMNTSSNHWGDILLDMLRIQGVDCSPPRGISLNAETGEIVTQNTPVALKKFQQTVEELNKPDGRCRYFQRVPSQQEILFTARFCKISSSDFDSFGLGKPISKATRTESSWWMLEPKQLNEIRQNMKLRGMKSLGAGIDTGYGGAAELYSGESTNHIELGILPIAPVNNPFGEKQMIDFKIQASTTGLFTNNPAGGWPNFADRTNCALFVEATVEDGGALVFRAENSANNDLIVLLEAGIKTKK